MIRSKTAAQLFALGGVAVVAGALAGCAGGDSGGTGEGGDDIVTVDLAYSTTSVLSAAPFAVAIEEGFFEDNGCRLGEQIEEELGGANTLRSVIDGGLDMGEVATNAVLEAALTGTPITAVGSSHQVPYDVIYAVQPGSGITGPEDLEGKTWGFTSPGSASEDLTYLVADEAGVDPDSINRTPTNGLAGGLALLESGGIDAALQNPILQSRDPDKFDIGFTALDFIEGYQKTVYVASQDFIDNNPDAIRCVLAGIDAGMKFITDDPEAAAAIYAQYNEDYEEEELAQELQSAVDQDTLVDTVGFNPTGLEAVARARELRTGEDADIPWSELFDPQYLPEGAATELPAEQ